MKFTNNINNKIAEIDLINKGKHNIRDMKYHDMVRCSLSIEKALSAKISPSGMHERTCIIRPKRVGYPYYANIFIDFDTNVITIERIRRTIYTHDVAFVLTPEENYALDNVAFPITVKPNSPIGQMYRRFHNMIYGRYLKEDFSITRSFGELVRNSEFEVRVYKLEATIYDDNLDKIYIDYKDLDSSYPIYNLFSKTDRGYSDYEKIETYMDYNIFTACKNYDHYLSYYNSPYRTKFNTLFFEKMLTHSTKEVDDVVTSILEDFYKEVAQNG